MDLGNEDFEADLLRGFGVVEEGSMNDRPEFCSDPGFEPGREVRTYCGLRQPDGTTVVRVDGHPLDLRGDFREQSATAFDWGYAGSGGPAQLALAILADHWANDESARRHYDTFMRRVIRNLPNQRWSMTSDQIDSSLRGDEEPSSAASAASGMSSYQATGR